VESNAGESPPNSRRDEECQVHGGAVQTAAVIPDSAHLHVLGVRVGRSGLCLKELEFPSLRISRMIPVVCSGSVTIAIAFQRKIIGHANAETSPQVKTREQWE